jgi:hypothetical protein
VHQRSRSVEDDDEVEILSRQNDQVQDRLGMLIDESQRLLMNNRQSSSSRLSQNAPRQSDEDQSRAVMHLKEILHVNNKHSNQSSLVMLGGLTSATNSKVNTRTASKTG